MKNGFQRGEKKIKFCNSVNVFSR